MNSPWLQQYMYLRAAVVMMLFASLTFAIGFLRGDIGRIYERAAFALAPSTERAYTYGTKHFDAARAAEYDIDRAEYFFERANELNPQLPLLQHQRARIAFLKGDFALALARINQELSQNPEPSLSSYYVRGLINGYAGDYEGAARDYETYLRADPKNWAGINDYAWVLLKAERPLDALNAVDWGLLYWPDNPWLLNSKATAHFELGQLDLAHEAVKNAFEEVAHVSEEEWMTAYPGNDPLIAPEGVRAFKKAVEGNMHTIAAAIEKAPKNAL